MFLENVDGERQGCCRNSGVGEREKISSEAPQHSLWDRYPWSWLWALPSVKGQQTFSKAFEWELHETVGSARHIIASPAPARESIAFGRWPVNICRSNERLFISRSLCWLGYCFSTRLYTSYFTICNVRLRMSSNCYGNTGRGEYVSLHRCAGILMKGRRQWLWGIKSFWLGDTFIALKDQVSVEGVIRISSDAKLIFQCV